MKNKRFLGLSFFLMGSVLAGCGCGGQIDGKTIEQVRSFAAAMKKDAADFNDLIYESSFREKYSVAYDSETNEEATSYSLQYHAEGDVLAGYALNANVSEPVSSATIFNKGTGYFTGRQQEKAKLSHVVTNKDNGEKTKNTQADYSLNHVFGVQFNSEELYASGKTSLTNNLSTKNAKSGEFSGKIAKKALKEFAENAVETTISRILYLEAWSNVSLFKEAAIDYFKGLDLSSNEKVQQFYNDKQIKLSETEESIHVDFVLEGGKIVEGLTGKDSGVTASVPASAQINKKTNLVTYSDYDFKALFLALLQKGNVNKKSYEVSVDACSLKTVLTSYSASDKKLDGAFVEYADSQRAEFVNQFEQYVIPSLDNVEIDA